MLIAHRCKTCKRPDYRECSHKSIRANKPEAMPTFDVAGRKVERFIKPGTKFGAGVDNGLGITAGFGVITCSCEDCEALHAQLTRIGGAPEPPSTAEPSPRQMRKWAAEVGMDCPKTGRVPAPVVEAYAAAHNNN